MSEKTAVNYFDENGNPHTQNDDDTGLISELSDKDRETVFTIISLLFEKTERAEYRGAYWAKHLFQSSVLLGVDIYMTMNMFVDAMKKSGFECVPDGKEWRFNVRETCIKALNGAKSRHLSEVLARSYPFQSEKRWCKKHAAEITRIQKELGEQNG